MCSVLKRSFSSGMLENTEGVECVALLLKHLTMIEGMGDVVGGANVMVIDVDIIAINEKFGGACFALVIVGSCFFYLNASTMWTFNYFDSFAHVCFPIL